MRGDSRGVAEAPDEVSGACRPARDPALRRARSLDGSLAALLRIGARQKSLTPLSRADARNARRDRDADALVRGTCFATRASHEDQTTPPCWHSQRDHDGG